MEDPGNAGIEKQPIPAQQRTIKELFDFADILTKKPTYSNEVTRNRTYSIGNYPDTKEIRVLFFNQDMKIKYADSYKHFGDCTIRVIEKGTEVGSKLSKFYIRKIDDEKEIFEIHRYERVRLPGERSDIRGLEGLSGIEYQLAFLRKGSGLEKKEIEKEEREAGLTFVSKQEAEELLELLKSVNKERK